MASNILDPSALIAKLPTLLPENDKTLQSPTDAVAALLHTAMTAIDFRLTAVDDDSSASQPQANVLPRTWRAHAPAVYTFRYRHNQSSLEFVLKVSKLATRTLVNAITTETDKVATLDIPTKDFTSQAFFPYDALLASAQPLVHGFISSARVADLVASFKLQVVQVLLPGLRKDGYQETESSATVAHASSGPSRQRVQPIRPERNEDIHPFQLPAPLPPGTNPLEIGRRDRDPFPPFNPFAPPPLFGGGGDDGMLVGPSHPIFGSRGPGRGPAPGGPWGGDGFLPPMGAPPGARFDPIGPFGPLPGRGPRGPAGVRDPDNDEFMPPGSSDMFS